MKTINVSTRAKTVNTLLRKAKRNGLILESPEGDRFLLTPLKDWIGFDVGNSRNFAKEVEATARNKKLIKHLAERRSHAKRIPLSKVKEEIGL
jgi:predicted transcriptional regulator